MASSEWKTPYSLFATSYSPFNNYARLDASQLKRDEIGLNRHRALDLRLNMIFSENRYTLFRIMLWSWLHRALHARVDRIERRRAADVQPVSLLATEAQIGDGFRNMDF